VSVLNSLHLPIDAFQTSSANISGLVHIHQYPIEVYVDGFFFLPILFVYVVSAFILTSSQDDFQTQARKTAVQARATKGDWIVPRHLHQSPPSRGFRFLELPAELRIKIYDYIFEKHVLEILPLTRSRGLTYWDRKSRKSNLSCAAGDLFVFEVALNDQDDRIEDLTSGLGPILRQAWQLCFSLANKSTKKLITCSTDE
jgi:hypothetical protein